MERGIWVVSLTTPDYTKNWLLGRIIEWYEGDELPCPSDEIVKEKVFKTIEKRFGKIEKVNYIDDEDPYDILFSLTINGEEYYLKIQTVPEFMYDLLYPIEELIEERLDDKQSEYRIKAGTTVYDKGGSFVSSEEIKVRSIKHGKSLYGESIIYVIEYQERKTYGIEVTPLYRDNEVIGFKVMKSYFSSSINCYYSERNVYIISKVPLRVKRIIYEPYYDRDAFPLTFEEERFETVYPIHEDVSEKVIIDGKLVDEIYKIYKKALRLYKKVTRVKY